MKKIYFLCLCLDAGGIEKAVCLQANAFADKGYHITIYSLFTSSPLLDLKKEIVVKTITPFYSDRLKKHNIIYKVVRKCISHIQLVFYIKSISSGIIISTRNEYSKLVSKYGKKNVLKIAELHADHNFNRKLLDDFRYRYSNIDYLIHLTDTSKNEIEQMISSVNRHTKNVLIPNFVTEYVCKDIKRHNYCIAVGRFSHEKGFDRLIDIWNMIIQQKKDWKLVLVGDGKERERLEQKVIEYKLQNYILFFGFLANECIMHIMNESKIYLMTSYTESFSFTCVEAMQNALPIVAFDVRTGPRALITNGKNGFLIEDGNTTCFVRKVLELMDNVELRESFGNFAVSRSKEYLRENIISQWEKIFGSVS